MCDLSRLSPLDIFGMTGVSLGRGVHTHMIEDELESGELVPLKAISHAIPYVSDKNNASGVYHFIFNRQYCGSIRRSRPMHDIPRYQHTLFWFESDCFGIFNIDK